MGIADPARVAVGGHSYGAFMTANLLAHTDLFAAGIARSGAYNRTLTPFGFQSERRSFWEVPQVYDQVSPFRYADQISAPILLIHGERRRQLRHLPDPVRAAVPGDPGHRRHGAAGRSCRSRATATWPGNRCCTCWPSSSTGWTMDGRKRSRSVGLAVRHGRVTRPRRSSRSMRPSLRVSLRLIRPPATAPVSSGPSENDAPARPGGEPPLQLPGQRRAGGQDQTAWCQADAAALRPGADVGSHPVDDAARGPHAVYLVQFGDELDLDADYRQRLGRDLDSGRGYEGQHRPGADRDADGGRGTGRAFDERLGDLVRGPVRILRA